MGSTQGRESLKSRATEARKKGSAASAALRAQMHRQSVAVAVERTEQVLETTTDPDEWTTTTQFPMIRVACILEVEPGIRIVNPKGTTDLMLMLDASNPQSWPTIRSLEHLGELIEQHGLG